MSLILKEINPKTDYGLCILTRKGELITANGKHIQAIQIPKDHGRIGDLGKLAKLISEYGESLKESVIGNRLLMTERDLCYAIAVLTEHFQEYEPLLEPEE